ncbi:hypothetical protein BH683_006895 [Williamsia sp. 1138]|nr:hypothetical protein BH683_006895 [Williamsia sp. 1138]
MLCSASLQTLTVSTQDHTTRLLYMRHRYAVPVLAMLLIALVVGLGVAIAVGHNPMATVDNSVLHWTVGHRSPAATTVMSGVTNLFGPAWVLTWTLLATVALILRDDTVMRGLTVLSTVAVAGALGTVFKAACHRIRPPLVDQASDYEVGKSFPSGHVTGTAALVCALALALTVASPAIWRTVAAVLALAISIFAAATRLYLGVHWFSDVVAAIVLAGAVALVMPAVVRELCVALSPHASPRFKPYIDPSIDANHLRRLQPESEHHASVAP